MAGCSERGARPCGENCCDAGLLDVVLKVLKIAVWKEQQHECPVIQELGGGSGHVVAVARRRVVKGCVRWLAGSARGAQWLDAASAARAHAVRSAAQDLLEVVVRVAAVVANDCDRWRLDFSIMRTGKLLELAMIRVAATCCVRYLGTGVVVMVTGVLAAYATSKNVVSVAALRLVSLQDGTMHLRRLLHAHLPFRLHSNACLIVRARLLVVMKTCVYFQIMRGAESSGADATSDALSGNTFRASDEVCSVPEPHLSATEREMRGLAFIEIEVRAFFKVLHLM